LRWSFRPGDATGKNQDSVDYRLVPKSKLPEILEDVQDAFLWIGTTGADLLNINPGKLAVAGDSAGGYLALMSGFCLSLARKL